MRSVTLKLPNTTFVRPVNKLVCWENIHESVRMDSHWGWSNVAFIDIVKGNRIDMSR